jgi:hypothetical protein
VSAPLLDNSTLSLSLEFSDGVTVSLRTVTVTLGDANGVLANLNGLMVAFFDQPTPDLFGAPVYKTASGTTDASGVLTFSANSVLAVGGTGGLVVRSASGQHYNGSVVVS